MLDHLAPVTQLHSHAHLGNSVGFLRTQHDGINSQVTNLREMEVVLTENFSENLHIHSSLICVNA